ncbi:MAG: hypothetical protein R3E10_15255 [Gemmatimonadota bacterium]
MRRATLLWVGLLLTSACELTETVVSEPEDVLVAEVFVRVGDPAPLALALLHTSRYTAPVPAARVTMSIDNGQTFELVADASSACRDLPQEAAPGEAACYRAPLTGSARIQPGDPLTVEIVAADGRRLVGNTVVPGAFDLIRPTASGSRCALPADTLVEIAWTRSEGAWAYVTETSIAGLPNYQGEDFREPLELLGLAISADDTTIVFPAEFGVFDRFDLDRDIALQLQKGLPALTGAVVFIAATDRNYVNWVRGGTFNPSGPVRIPSLRGDGFGVFGTYVQRYLFMDQDVPASNRPACTLE